MRSPWNTIYGILLLVLASAATVHTASAQTRMPANNAAGVCQDAQFKLTFNAAPVLQSAGKISLYKSDGTLVHSIDLSQMPSGTPASATWPWTETLNGNTIRVFRVAVDGQSAIISFPIGSMAYNTGYYVTVNQNVFSNAGALGFTGIAAKQWNVTTRTKPAADLNYTVAADGSGDFATLQGALDFIPSGNTSKARIYIKNGTYTGLAFSSGKHNITVEGESADGVILKAFNNSVLNASTHYRSVVNMSGNDLNFISLTIINTTPNGGMQAEALKLNGNRIVIVNCRFYSYQDTVLLEGKVYLKDCLIEGDVDFIWGVGTVFFQSCELRANDNGGYNAMARNDNTKHGYAFADCKITRTSAATATQYLGRDANTTYPYAELVYLNCAMDKHIAATGWQIRNEMDAALIVFAEYKSVDMSGNLINTSSRHAKSRQLTAAQNTQYRDLNWFFNGWVPVVPAATAHPTVVITQPANNATFAANSNITLTASASAGSIASVDFYSGSTLLATKTVSPYSFVWSTAVAGSYSITAVVTDNAGNTATSSAIAIKVAPAQAPYHSTAWPIPGAIECENFDEGGNGFAYLDNTTGSAVTPVVNFRTNEDVDIEICTDADGGYNVGYMTKGEWMEYTVNVALAGYYNIDLRVACNGDARTLALEMNDKVISSTIAIPNTAGWQTYQTVTLTNIPLTAGVQVMRLIMGATDYVNLNYVAFTPTTRTQPIALAKGWNLISTNVRPADSTIATLFKGLDVLEIKDMNSYWRKDQPSFLNSLQTITPGEGYLVNMNVAGKLMIAGTPLTIDNSPLTVKSGWQLIGCPYPAATPVAGVLGSNFLELKDFEGFLIPNNAQSTIDSFEPGKGYFIKK